MTATDAILQSDGMTRKQLSGMWFFTCQFAMWPMTVIDPFRILLTAAAPAPLYRQIARAGIIEWLRQ